MPVKSFNHITIGRFLDPYLKVFWEGVKLNLIQISKVALRYFEGQKTKEGQAYSVRGLRG